MALKSKSTKGNSLSAMILDSYKQYVDFGYPADPKVYEVRASGGVYEAILKSIDMVQYTGKSKAWPFKVVEDLTVTGNKFTFGPEQITITLEN